MKKSLLPLAFIFSLATPVCSVDASLPRSLTSADLKEEDGIPSDVQNRIDALPVYFSGSDEMECGFALVETNMANARIGLSDKRLEDAGEYFALRAMGRNGRNALRQAAATYFPFYADGMTTREEIDRRIHAKAERCANAYGASEILKPTTQQFVP